MLAPLVTPIPRIPPQTVPSQSEIRLCSIRRWSWDRERSARVCNASQSWPGRIRWFLKWIKIIVWYRRYIVVHYATPTQRDPAFYGLTKAIMTQGRSVKAQQPEGGGSVMTCIIILPSKRFPFKSCTHIYLRPATKVKIRAYLKTGLYSGP